MKKLLFVAMLTLLLAGCGTAEFEIHKDGSADIVYKLKSDDEFIDFEGMKAALEEEEEKSAEETGIKDLFKVDSIKEKDGVITAKVSTSDVGLFQLDDEEGISVYHLPVSESITSKSKWFEGLKDSDGKAVDLNEKKLNDLIVLHVTDVMFEEVSFKLPGKVKYVSDGVKIEGKNKVVSDENTMTVVYEKKGGFFGTLLKIVAVLLVLVAIIAFVTTRKSKKTTAQPTIGGTSSNE